MLVKVNGKIMPVERITDGGLYWIGGRLFHPSGIELRQDPGEKLKFELVLEGEVAKREMDPLLP